MIEMKYIEPLQNLRDEYYTESDAAIIRRDAAEATRYFNMARAVSECITRLLNYDMNNLIIARMEEDLQS